MTWCTRYLNLSFIHFKNASKQVFLLVNSLSLIHWVVIRPPHSNLETSATLYCSWLISLFAKAFPCFFPRWNWEAYNNKDPPPLALQLKKPPRIWFWRSIARRFGLRTSPRKRCRTQYKRGDSGGAYHYPIYFLLSPQVLLLLRTWMCEPVRQWCTSNCLPFSFGRGEANRKSRSG